MAELRARTLGGDLSLALQDVAEGNDTRIAALRDARAKVSPVDDVLGLLDTHTALLAEWLQGSPSLRALLAATRLDEETLMTARDAAEALRRERTRTNSTQNTSVDGAEVNIVEGRVLYEIRRLRKAFNRARERYADRTVPALVHAPIRQRVFLTVDREEEPAAPPAPPTP